MRIVKEPKDFERALESAKNESLKAFDDDKMLVEKFVERPRFVFYVFVSLRIWL